MQEPSLARTALSGSALGCGMFSGCALATFAGCFGVLLFCLLFFGMMLNSCERADQDSAPPIVTEAPADPLLLPRSSVVQ